MKAQIEKTLKIFNKHYEIKVPSGQLRSLKGGIRKKKWSISVKLLKKSIYKI